MLEYLFTVSVGIAIGVELLGLYKGENETRAKIAAFIIMVNIVFVAFYVIGWSIEAILKQF